MKQQEFLNKLDSLLINMDEKERKDILDDFKQHFKDGLEQGKTEEEIATLLGSPEEIVKQFSPEDDIHNETKYSENTNNTSQSSGTAGKVFIIIALAFLNICITFPVVCGIFGGLVGLYAGALAIFVSAIAVIVVSFIAIFASFLLVAGPFIAIALFFLALGLICLALLATIGLVKLTKWLAKLLYKYVLFNAKLVREGL